MFEILDGRKHFYQWDINQQLKVNDETIKEIHFSNNKNDEAIVCEVKQENNLNVVNIPNILLQNDWKLFVYAYDVNHTKVEASFTIVKRSKPADYVYTETEVKNYDELEKRIKALEESGGVGKEYATTEYVDSAIDEVEATIDAKITSALAGVENGTY